MSKRYDEPADVEADAGGQIEAFWWRGRRYRVRRILSRWREAGGWWESAADTAQPWVRGESKEILRVDAFPDPQGSASQEPPPRERVVAEARSPAGVAGVTTATALFAARSGGHHPAGRRRVRAPVAGTYELSRDLRKGTWTLLRIWD